MTSCLFSWTSFVRAEWLRGGWGKPATSFSIQLLPGASESTQLSQEASCLESPALLSQRAAEPAEVLPTPSRETWLARITQGTRPTTKLVRLSILARTGQQAVQTDGKGASAFGPWLLIMARNVHFRKWGKCNVTIRWKASKPDAASCPCCS